ncbi:hypothetical protein E3N88_07861 [Mikania micrantha]|uniref:Endonuclease/exonuclease/phosphatase domain-containing protein n=1 Tax=Mikania micrantha TaxID=192012 RepID=A0A5N6PGV3_9ASTR|nr:hypothetical protein E3N88_07861 [Mikania micrantha]
MRFGSWTESHSEDNHSHGTSVQQMEMNGHQVPQEDERPPREFNAWEKGNVNPGVFKFSSGTNILNKGDMRTQKAPRSKLRAQQSNICPKDGGFKYGSDSGSRPKKRPRKELEANGPNNGQLGQSNYMPDLNTSPSLPTNSNEGEGWNEESQTVVPNSLVTLEAGADEMEEGQIMENQDNEALQGEINNTILVAESVGIHLAGMYKEVREEIHGEETMFSDVTRINSKGYWGNQRFEAAAVPSNGRSGGLLSMWDPSIFHKLSESCSKNFILVSGVISGSSEMVHVLNVYGPQNLQEKKSLWNDLELIKASNPGVWLMVGDFNEVRSSMERKGSEFCHLGASNFNDFIHGAQLMEYKMGGLEFTYMKGSGESFSKLDRFLVCDNFIRKWPNACVTALPRKWSDHCPIILVTSEIDFGPVPFRFFSSWFKFPGLEGVVQEALNSTQMGRYPDKVLANKLKVVKEALKSWIRDQSSKKK